MIIEYDKIIMDDGHVYYVNNGSIGLSPEGNISQGYDGTVTNFDYSDHSDTIPSTHVREIALYMSDAWKKLAEKC